MESGEKRLWIAVLDLAISDTLTARHSRSLLHRRMQWFREDNPDFQMICNLADSDPQTVRNLLTTLLKKGDSHDIKKFTGSARFYVRSEKMINRKRRKRIRENIDINKNIT
jgi:hypothetical protein